MFFHLPSTGHLRSLTFSSSNHFKIKHFSQHIITNRPKNMLHHYTPVAPASPFKVSFKSSKSISYGVFFKSPSYFPSDTMSRFSVWQRRSYSTLIKPFIFNKSILPRSNSTHSPHFIYSILVLSVTGIQPVFK